MTIFCPLCQDQAMDPCLAGVPDYEYDTPGEHDFLRCAECGLLAIDPMPTIEMLKRAYPPDYHGFHTSTKGVVGSLYKIVYHLRIRHYASLLPRQGQFLDVGCADAPYFEALLQLRPDVEVHGVEFIDEIAGRARARGHDVKTGVLTDIEPGEAFDLIVMNNLIEHVPDPVEELAHAVRLLRPGGYVLLETPNVRSWDFSCSRQYWGGLHAPRHTFLFSPKSLEALAHRCSLDIASWTFPVNTDHWALSVQNYLRSRMNGGLRLVRGRAWFFKYLLFAFIPVNVVQRFLGRTGSVVCLLQKPVSANS